MKVLKFKHAIVLLILAASFVKPAHAAEELSSARIRILEVTPPSGATIDEHTVIRAKIEYEIKNFKPDSGRYIATVLFDSTTRRLVIALPVKVKLAIEPESCRSNILYR